MTFLFSTHTHTKYKGKLILSINFVDILIICLFNLILYIDFLLFQINFLFLRY